MWNRAELKQRAREVLKGCYWSSFIMALAYTVCGGGEFNLKFLINDNTKNNYLSALDMESIFLVIIIAMIVVVFALIFSVGFKMFVTNPIEVSTNRFFIRAVFGEISLDNIAYGFKNKYLNSVRTLFFRDLYVALWSMLLVVPGIIKGIEYIFVPYLIADNPSMDTKRAFEISKAMTDGQKWNIFVLKLSFIGWYLLGVLACGIGVLFVAPYQYATDAQLYLTFKENAMCRGIITNMDM